MNAVIVGYGNVGKATAEILGIEYWIDPNGSNISLEDAAKLDWALICVPTPTLDGKCDLHNVQDAIASLSGFPQVPFFVIRSTVPPNTANVYARIYGVTIVSYPCFGSERTMAKDERRPALVVIGAEDEAAGFEFADACQGVHAFHWQQPMLLTDSTTAEFIKYAFNSLFATKVVWANEMRRVCERLEIDYPGVRDALYLHPWVGNNHLDARGRDAEGFYAGGSCLPKDLEAFANYSRSELLYRVLELNRGQLLSSSQGGRMVEGDDGEEIASILGAESDG